MKTLRMIAVVTILALGSSCSDFLDLAPISSSSAAMFYKSQADYDQAVVGAYSKLRNAYHDGYYILFSDLRSDNTTMLDIGGGTEVQKMAIDNFNINPINDNINYFWTYSYQAIQIANAVLSRIESASIDKVKQDQFKGESEAIRALMYFDLVRMFGGVPVVTEGDVNIANSYNIPRSSVEDVYKLIVDDLTDAVNRLPVSYTGTDIGRITKGAAQTLLGQVYLTQKKFSEAAAQFDAVISGNVYSLLPKYEDNFTGVDQGNKEAVWQVLFKGDGSGYGSNYPNWCAPTGSNGVLTGTGGSFGFNQPTVDIYNAYTAGDLRRDVSISLGYTLNGNFVSAKYIKLYVDRSSGKNNDSDADWNVFRYSHVLLMCAEALNEINSGPTSAAYTYINQVRARAGLAPLSGLSQSSFRDAVYQETRLEVAFEGHRWFDLIRTGRAVEVMNSKLEEADPIGPSDPINSNQLLYPIHQNVILTSTPGIITQNPGY